MWESLRAPVCTVLSTRPRIACHTTLCKYCCPQVVRSSREKNTHTVRRESESYWQTLKLFPPKDPSRSFYLSYFARLIENDPSHWMSIWILESAKAPGPEAQAAEPARICSQPKVSQVSTIPAEMEYHNEKRPSKGPAAPTWWETCLALLLLGEQRIYRCFARHLDWVRNALGHSWTFLNCCCSGRSFFGFSGGLDRTPLMCCHCPGRPQSSLAIQVNSERLCFQIEPC